MTNPEHYAVLTFLTSDNLPTGIKVLFVAGFGLISSVPEQSARFYRDLLGLPLQSILGYESA
jgi:hypothetical protein